MPVAGYRVALITGCSRRIEIGAATARALAASGAAVVASATTAGPPFDADSHWRGVQSPVEEIRGRGGAGASAVFGDVMATIAFLPQTVALVSPGKG